MKIARLLAIPVVLASKSSLRSAGNNIADRLEADGTADQTASEDAKCWCKELSETLETRSREGTQELRFLNSRKSERDINNHLLRMEVAGHHAQASEHQQSLDSGAAIMGKSQADYDDEQAFHEKALEGVRKALEKVPEGTGGEVHGALKGLEESFSSKMKEAETQHAGKFDGLRESKQEMLKLANEAAEMKQGRLAEGENVVATATAEIAAYDARAEMDQALGAAIQGLCPALETGATDRLTLRQEAAIALSQEAVVKSSAAAAKASSRVLLLANHAGAQDPASDAKELSTLLGKTTHIEAELAKVLNSIVMTGHLAETTGQVKTAVEALSKHAESDVAALPSLFQAFMTAGSAASKADNTLVAVLKKNHQDA